MSQTLLISDGDAVISSANGRPITISDGTKLSQDVREFFTVAVQPNGFGSGLEELVGVVELGPDILVSIADRQITDGLDTFISLQQSEPRIQRPTNERVVSVTDLHVDVDSQDPTKFYFRANINTEAGLQVPFEQVI